MLVFRMFQMVVYPWVALFWLVFYPISSVKRILFGGRKAPIKLTEQEEERMNDPALGTYRMIKIKDKQFRILQNGDTSSGLVKFIFLLEAIKSKINQNSLFLSR